MAEDNAVDIRVEEEPKKEEIVTEVEKETPPSDIEVIIGGTEEDKKEEPPKHGEPEERKTKKRKGNSEGERIARVIEDRRRAEEYAQEKEREAAEERQKRIQAEEKLRFSMEGSINAYEKEAEARFNMANADYKRAVESGDVDAITAANAKVAEAATYKQRVAESKANYKPPVAEKKEEKAQTTQTQAQDSVSPVAQKWISDNSWIDKNSDDFDEARAVDALTYAANLADEMKRDGRTAQIGTKSYFNMVDQYVRQQYGEGEEVELVNKKQPASPVAPQARTSAPSQSAQTSKKTVINLTPDEAQVALSLNLRNKDGSLKSNQEHYEVYALSKYEDQKRFSDRDKEQAKRSGR